MSVTFYVRGNGGPEVNMSNCNARDVLDHLNLEGETCYGEVRGMTLREQCNAALQQPRDPEVQGVTEGRVIYCGRRSGYLQDRSRELLGLALEAGDLGIIYWG